jgi:fructose-1,6-bisphosphatase I
MRPTTFLTAEQFILQEQQHHHPQASGEFSWLLSGITLATKFIAAAIRRGRLADVLGETDDTNIHGEAVQRLDVLANQTLLSCLGDRGNVGILASEENEQPTVVLQDPQCGKYVVVFDPLDGSSNIDVNVSVGTIFSILKRDIEVGFARDPLMDVLQRGTRQVAAGYVLYSASTMLVFSTGDGVHCFTLDPAIGAYMLTQQGIQMPERGPYYSVNEANLTGFPPAYGQYLTQLRDEGSYSSRYVGSLVADFHRTLLKGGVFLYPPTVHYPNGKLRLLYEANPIAFLAEQAGGVATDGRRRILEVEPTSLHQRTPLAVGSCFEMELFGELTAAGMRRQAALST